MYVTPVGDESSRVPPLRYTFFSTRHERPCFVGEISSMLYTSFSHSFAKIDGEGNMIYGEGNMIDGEGSMIDGEGNMTRWVLYGSSSP